jgi:hypothetical protein
MPEMAQIAIADHKPSAKRPKEKVASPLTAEPVRRIERASIRSVRAVRNGTASM